MKKIDDKKYWEKFQEVVDNSLEQFKYSGNHELVYYQQQTAYRNAKSGVIYQPKQRLHPLLPRNIHKQSGKYGWNITINGVRYRKNGFSTIAEAENDFKIKLKELRG